MTNAWITHVKNYAAKNNVSYKEALGKASASYKKQKGEGCRDMWRKGKKQSKINPERDYTPEEETQRTLRASSRNPQQTRNPRPVRNRQRRLPRGLDVDYPITEETAAQLARDANNLNQIASRSSSFEGEGKKKKKRNNRKKIK